VLFLPDCTHAASSPGPDSQSRKSTRHAFPVPNRYSISRSSRSACLNHFFVCARASTSFSCHYLLAFTFASPHNPATFWSLRGGMLKPIGLFTFLFLACGTAYCQSPRVLPVQTRGDQSFSRSDSILVHRKLQPGRLQKRYFHFETIPRPLSLGETRPLVLRPRFLRRMGTAHGPSSPASSQPCVLHASAQHHNLFQDSFFRFGRSSR
jgi:hypothetical protein